MEPPPNVVLVVLDTVRRDRVSAYGYGRETTPAFDSFADRATLFADAISQSSWSIPSHASLFTGQYPTDHGATTVRPILRVDRTLPELLSGAGYGTFAVSHNEYVRPATGFGSGFDEFHTDSRLTVPPPVASALAPVVHRLTGSPTVRRPVEQVFNACLKPTIPVDGTIDSFHGDRVRCKSITDSVDRYNEAGVSPPPDDGLLDRAADVLGRVEDPFFLFVNLVDVHLPRSPDPAYAEQFVDDDLSDVRVVTTERAHTFGEHRMGERGIRKMGQLYDADLRTMDDKLGELLATLESRDVLRDSLVILVSDHGEHLGEFGLIGHQHSVFDSVVSVPLAVRFPDGGPDVIDEQVETRRVFHTVLDVAGVESYPQQSLATYQGDTPESSRGDNLARGSFSSPMLDVERLVRDGEVEYDPALLGEPLSFSRDGSHKRIEFGDKEWLFPVPERETGNSSRWERF